LARRRPGRTRHRLLGRLVQHQPPVWAVRARSGLTHRDTTAAVACRCGCRSARAPRRPGWSDGPGPATGCTILHGSPPRWARSHPGLCDPAGGRAVTAPSL